VQAAIVSIFRSPLGLLLVLAVLALAAYLLSRPKPGVDGPAHGPRYDLIFAVNTFDPSQPTAVSLSPYVIDGTLYLQAEKLPANQGTISSWVSFYRYNSKTGIAEQLPSPGISEMQNIEGKQDYVFSAIRHLKLDTDAQSPDGFSLAPPAWVPVGPVGNVLGNIFLFLSSGKFETITERENTPRLVRDAVSVAMKADRSLLNNEADDAFLLGWIVPDSLPKARR
jgi:hypothetical protein